MDELLRVLGVLVDCWVACVELVGGVGMYLMRSALFCISGVVDCWV